MDNAVLSLQCSSLLCDVLLYRAIVLVDYRLGAVDFVGIVCQLDMIGNIMIRIDLNVIRCNTAQFVSNKSIEHDEVLSN